MYAISLPARYEIYQSRVSWNWLEASFPRNFDYFTLFKPQCMFGLRDEFLYHGLSNRSRAIVLGNGLAHALRGKW